MTIIRGTDDQQVPDSSFDVVNADSGATVIQKSLPDLDSLLLDLQGFAEAEVEKQKVACLDGGTCEVPEKDFLLAPVIEELDMMDTHNELSFYDDCVWQIKRIKPEICDDYYGAPPIQTEPDDLSTCMRGGHGQLPPVEDFLGAHTQGMEGCSMHYDDGLYDATVQKIEQACMTVAIHNDPFNWTVDEVRRWAAWAVGQFSGLQPDFGELALFDVDGTTLCMLTKDDFIKRSPAVGEYLYAELEIWKNTYTLQTVPVNPAAVESSPDNDVSYLDLDELNQSTSSLSSLQSYPGVGGAPVYMPSATLMSHSVHGLMEVERVLPHPTLASCSSVSPTPSLDSTGSCGNSASSWSSPVRADLEVKREPKEELVAFRPHVHHGKQATHLWQFLKELLLQPQSFQNCIRWLNRVEGIFKIEDSARVAKLWGQRKNRPAMNYDKLSRSIRQYYKKGIIKKTTNSKRLVYQFCPQYM